MKKSYLYATLFGIPGLFVTVRLTVVFLGAVAGFLWFFVFSDSRWPEIASCRGKLLQHRQSDQGGICFSSVLGCLKKP